ncbi:hypothetical protein G3I60_00095 [Streptomyces sp. SID13666]|uniref:Uncharacterized protein n=1 Tax=Streptomyces fildesensis TaxID=375757 RepID=A0ABW8C6T4_9ACTN|nr:MULTISPECIES: hypothetical protein [Streptomyces]MCM2417373.1 hypothetical protein [Streptomyces sp. RKAG293]MCM2430400.1 hypothetical protein [Streptomyces sp. RKAG337]MCZ4102252.1 hypothetical protein [Streptomyces sp. H39-C1]NEA52617.1 hypothetical protein [Streptomyces sp. SID13666]NEA70056.1 hypothetical protein [Streptomyces sp. SID13588]
MNARHERAGHSNGQGLDGQRPAEDPAEGRAARFGQLPERIAPEQMVEESPSDPPNDPQFGRNPDNDWLIRYCA